MSKGNIIMSVEDAELIRTSLEFAWNQARYMRVFMAANEIKDQMDQLDELIESAKEPV